VTALAAEADSFSGDKRLTRAQPGPGRDVACPVTVGIVLAAVRADDDVLPWPSAASAAGMAVEAGAAGNYEDHSPSGAFSLGDEDPGELSPGGIQYRPVAPSFLCDIPSWFLNGATSRGGQTADEKVLQRQDVVWERLSLHVGDDDHIPTAALPLELQCLHPARHWPMLPDLELADSLKPGMCPSTGIDRHPPGTVSGGEPYLVEPLVGLEPRVADLASSGIGTSEEGSEGCIEAAEGLLLGGEGMPSLPIRVASPDLSELGGLVVVADPHPALAPGVSPFLKSRVVQVAVVAQQPDRATALRDCRVGAELQGPSHETITQLMPPACRRHVTTRFGAAPIPRPKRFGPPGGY
jgi:hypothetical protein